ncbi:MAG: recombination protein O N-terminal domain-containing protein, partial [Candidatus Terrybacteria bacterium]|nr:recombination protein O N-terminal domain-containing protein [Candidatus Terrybacteria bacterium]
MEALVLRGDGVGEADISVTLLTREGRRVEGFARSARQPSSR